MKRLYVQCKICDLIFFSGFEVESPTQLLNFSYLCPKCGTILPCAPPKYLEKIGDKFRKALRKEEIFALLPPKSLALSGIFGKEFKLDRGVKLPPDVYILSDGAFVKCEAEK